MKCGSLAPIKLMASHADSSLASTVSGETPSENSTNADDAETVSSEVID